MLHQVNVIKIKFNSRILMNYYYYYVITFIVFNFFTYEFIIPPNIQCVITLKKFFFGNTNIKCMNYQISSIPTLWWSILITKVQKYYHLVTGRKLLFFFLPQFNDSANFMKVVVIIIVWICLKNYKFTIIESFVPIFFFFFYVERKIICTRYHLPSKFVKIRNTCVSSFNSNCLLNNLKISKFYIIEKNMV